MEKEKSIPGWLSGIIWACVCLLLVLAAAGGHKIYLSNLLLVGLICSIGVAAKAIVEAWKAGRAGGVLGGLIGLLASVAATCFYVYRILSVLAFDLADMGAGLAKYFGWI